MINGQAIITEVILNYLMYYSIACAVFLVILFFVSMWNDKEK